MGDVDPTAIEARLRAFFEEDPRGAVAAYLFGSVARGEFRADSDVDVGVLFASDPPARLSAPQFAIEAALERLLGRPVQIVALNRASADLVHRVLRDGLLVLDRDRAARIRFEVQRRNEYFDLAPIRRLYRRYPASATASAGRVAERGR
jgi:predicted nucleotidyltransferase